MKLNQKQKDLVDDICTELELSGDIAVFESEVCKLFPEFKEEFKLMCKMKRKFEKTFEKLGDKVWLEFVDENEKKSS